MKEFNELGVHSMILTSGTLSPLEILRSELQIPFPVDIENEHVIGPGQISVSLIPSGPSGYRLNSSYRTRSHPEYISELGHALIKFANVIPDGYVLYF